MKPHLPTDALHMAVHSLPVAAQPAPRGRLKLIALLVLSSLPMILAYVAFMVVRPHGEASFGELLYPARPMPEGAVVQGLDGAAQPLVALQRQWLLVRVDGGACGPACQKSLTLLRQLRLTLGKDQQRVDWVWLVDDEAPVAAGLAMALATDHATVRRASAAALAPWLPAASADDRRQWVYVVDPLGNAMMRFPAHFDAAAATKLRRDLDRLLRASASWDLPGR